MTTSQFGQFVDYENPSQLFSDETLATPMISATFNECREVADIRGAFGPDSRLSLSENLWNAIKSGRQQKLSIGEMNVAPGKTIKVTIAGFTGSIKALSGSSGEILMGRCGAVRIDARLGHQGRLLIGDKTTVNGAQFIAVGDTIVLGKDNMLSSEILMQGIDQHGIIDIATREFINAGRSGIVTGQHCWIGRRATVLPSTKIGAGSIVGACSLITTDVPPNSIAAGVPARVIRTGATWTRPSAQIDPETADYLDLLAAEAAPGDGAPAGAVPEVRPSEAS